MLLMLVLVAIFIAGIGYWKYVQIQRGMAMGAKFGPPPSAVTTIVVQPQQWQPVLRAVGSLRAVNGVVVSTDLAGIITEIAFESGRQVKKGDVLVKLDTQQEEAQLRSAEARLELARSDLERRRELLAKKAIAQAEFDAAESQLRQMQASVQEMKALMDRKRINAPFDGVIGIRQVDVGQYLNPGAAIAQLQSLDPIYVEFALPQQHLATVELKKRVRITATGFGQTAFEGEINAIDPQVNEASRNFTVQATIQNPEHRLRPGMFVDVEVLLPMQEGVLAIPSTSIAYAPFGDSVYVIREVPGPDGKAVKQAQQQFVKLGPTRGDQVTILSGLQPGDEVVTSGAFKLRPGAPVQVNNSVQPGNELNPKPANS
jgi:membrane fusion protein, multidrug efflux system